MGSEFRVEYLNTLEERWDTCIMRPKGPLLCLEKDGKMILLEVIEGYEFKGSKAGFRLVPPPDASKFELTFRVENEKDVAVIEHVLSKILKHASKHRKEIEKKKSEVSTSALTLSGYLVKSNKIRKKWKEVTAEDLEGMKWQRRWFLMSSDQLSYFETNDHVTSLGYFSLSGCKVHSESLSGRENTFVLQTSNAECVFLTAESDDDHDKWTHILKKYHKLEKAIHEVSSLSDKQKKSLEKEYAHVAGVMPDTARTSTTSSLSGSRRTSASSTPVASAPSSPRSP